MKVVISDPAVTPVPIKSIQGTQVINGRPMSKTLLSKIQIFVEHCDPKPALGVVLVGDNPASQIYVRNKMKAAQNIGIRVELHHLSSNIPAKLLLETIQGLNQNPLVHGILLQLPLPSELSANDFISAIDPKKDVDGFHPINVGHLWSGLHKEHFVPCTPKGCLRLINTIMLSIKGMHAVVVGRSNVVGKPMAALLLQQDATVTMAHSATKDLQDITRMADILVVAAGCAEMISRHHLKEGAIVIDVGINRMALGDDQTKLVGDVNFQDVLGHVRAITPVPGGVGPMTIASLMENVVQAYCLQRNQPWPVF